MPQDEFGPTLTNITAAGRQAVKYGAIALVVLIVGRTVLTAAINYYKAVNPPPPPPPTMGFGALPALVFPTQSAQDKPSSYTLEIPNRLPTFGDRAKVFLMPNANLTLLSDQRVREVATRYGFVFAPEILDTRIYRWSKSRPLESTLEVNAETLSLKLQTDFLARPELLTKSPPDAAQATSRVKAFLSSTDLLDRDVATATAQVTYLKALGSELEEAVSPSDADFIQIDLNRSKIDNQFAMFGPQGDKGAIHAIVTGALNGNDSVVAMEYNYFPVDYLQVHTYPLRSTESAWRILQAGEGYVAQKGDQDIAVIREVRLGYFEAFTEQPYLQPIYVFMGDGGFMGYVSALDPRVIGTATSQ